MSLASRLKTFGMTLVFMYYTAVERTNRLS